MADAHTVYGLPLVPRPVTRGSNNVKKEKHLCNLRSCYLKLGDSVAKLQQTSNRLALPPLGPHQHPLHVSPYGLTKRAPGQTAMESVPETERMEEFRPSPVPTLRLENPDSYPPAFEVSRDPTKKPPNVRRSTEPIPSSPSSPSWTASAASLPYRPRTTSPLSGSHSRSRSAATLAPSMSRTQSMPGVNGAGHILYSPQLRPVSPSGSPSRARPARKAVDEAFPPTSPVRTSVLEPERRAPERSSSPNLGVAQPTAIARHRRPSSPLRHLAHAGNSSLPNAPTTPSSIASSPSYRAYDTFSASYGIALSSVPTTPTSARSRSPSISSLETIPDSPDAEEAAMEAEKLARLQAVEEEAEGSDSSDSNSRGRSSLDIPTRGRTLGFGSRDKRKRWSVCGAERRGDIDLETIWED